MKRGVWRREKDDALTMLQQRLDQDSAGSGPGMPRLVGWPGDGDAKQGQPPLLANEPACRRISELEVRPLHFRKLCAIALW